MCMILLKRGRQGHMWVTIEAMLRKYIIQQDWFFGGIYSGSNDWKVVGSSNSCFRLGSEVQADSMLNIPVCRYYSPWEQLERQQGRYVGISPLKKIQMKYMGRRSLLSPLYHNCGKNSGSPSFKIPFDQRMNTKTTLLRGIGLKHPTAPKNLSKSQMF